MFLKECPDDIHSNLIENAIKYTPEGGTITVRAAGTDASVNLCVEDNGIGIDAADLPRIFDRFYRVDKARARKSGGNGIGLARQVPRRAIRRQIKAERGRPRLHPDLPALPAITSYRESPSVCLSGFFIILPSKVRDFSCPCISPTVNIFRVLDWVANNQFTFCFQTRMP